MEGWNTPASARSATEAAMARRVFGRGEASRGRHAGGCDDEALRGENRRAAARAGAGGESSTRATGHRGGGGGGGGDDAVARSRGCGEHPERNAALASVSKHETAKPGVGVSHAGVQDQGEDRRGSERRGRWNENAAEAGGSRRGARAGRRVRRAKDLAILERRAAMVPGNARRVHRGERIQGRVRRRGRRGRGRVPG